MNRRKFFHGLAAAAIMANSLVRADFAKVILPKQIIDIKTQPFVREAGYKVSSFMLREMYGPSLATIERNDSVLLQQTIDYAYRRGAKVRCHQQILHLQDTVYIPKGADVEIWDCCVYCGEAKDLSAEDVHRLKGPIYQFGPIAMTA